MSVQLVVLRLEVDQECPIVNSLHYQAENYLSSTKERELIEITSDLSFTLQSEKIIVPKDFKEIPLLHRGKREFKKLTIETYYQEMDVDSESAAPPSHLNESSDCGHSISQQLSESSDSGRSLSKSPLTLQYFSGNPAVEMTKGIMHLYKDKFLTSIDGDVSRSEMICMLGVPAKYNCQELQEFIAPASDSLKHIQIIRDSKPNQYMVLIKFKDQLSADIFYQEYDGKSYNMLENEFSHLVYVSRVESVKTSVGGYLPVSGLTELPTCPVCLERMDESVAGILTILCNHSFHNDCLMKWQDSCCPVCRYCQTPEETVEQTCFECDSKESLWICLICGHIGCGRYSEQHAYQHYQQTAHTFSMHLGNQRVWDYAGDNYVHRLIQNKGDGKLVSLDNSEMLDGEKMDSLTLEYTYLLTNQLESQRLYFEEKIESLEREAHDRISLLEESIHRTKDQCQIFEKKYFDCEKEKKNVEKKYENVVSKVANLAKELRDEKQMNICLRDNQVMWQQQVNQLKKKYKECDEKKSLEILELQSEVADLIKHLEVQSAVGNAEHGIKQDIQGGHVFVDQSSPSASPAKGGARSRTKSRKK